MICNKNAQYTIFEYFAEQHNLTLLESEIQEVERLVNSALQDKLQAAVNQYNAVVQQNKDLQQELKNLKDEIFNLLTTQAKELNGYERLTFLGKPIEYWLQKDQQLKVFNDNYFNNLTYAQIAELAKKSIRFTKEHCSDLHKIEELEEELAELKEENEMNQTNAIEFRNALVKIATILKTDLDFANKYQGEMICTAVKYSKLKNIYKVIEETVGGADE